MTYSISAMQTYPDMYATGGLGDLDNPGNPGNASSTTMVAASPTMRLVGLALVVGAGFLIFRHSKNEAEIRSKLVEKEGAAGLAKYEDARLRRTAGEQGLNLLGSWLSPQAMRRNSRRRRRIRKNSRRRSSRRR
jgi:hypothetical protein